VIKIVNNLFKKFLLLTEDSIIDELQMARRNGNVGPKQGMTDPSRLLIILACEQVLQWGN